MQLNPSEISELIKRKIQNYELAAESRGEGTVVSVTDGIVRIHGLADAVQGEMLEFPGDSFGMALNLERDSVGAVVLGPYKHITEGDTVKCTGRIIEVPVGEALLGRVVNPLGKPLDGKGPVATTETLPLERIAPGVISRQSVNQPIQTGLKAIDAMVPIGRGQRELIIGDRQTGKTALAIDTILTKNVQVLNVSMWLLGKKRHRLPTSCVNWKNMRRWHILSLSPLRLLKQPLCNILHLMRVVRWESFSGIGAKMH
jgi:F-type H+-transporting ATPase subunit alpha